MKKTLLAALFALSMLHEIPAALAAFSTPLPYQCVAMSKGLSPEYWGKASSRMDWARSSALEACRKGSSRPAKCAVTYCTSPDDNDQPSEPTFPSPPEDGRCNNSIECHGFEICVNGRCIDKGNSDNRCSSSIDCGFPTQCINGRCLDSNDPQCNNNSDCSGFDICVGNKCVSDGSSDNRCFSNMDCGWPNSCVDGKCQR